jgi:tetratricopeptide (TPR) repeat protein
MNAGVFFGPAAEEWDKSLDYIKKYHEKGGSNADSYIMLFSIYRDKKKDNDTALKIAQDMVKRFPNNSDFPKYELDMYVKMNRLPEAKAVMLKQATAEPENKEARYFLGVISYEMKDNVEARKWYEEAIKLDAKYFEPQIGLADLIYLDAKEVKSQMNQLGNSKEDFKKKVELDKVYQDKLKIALPYWEKCEKLSPDEGKVLDVLYLIYNDLEMTAQVTRIEKRMKALGLLD